MMVVYFVSVKILFQFFGILLLHLLKQHMKLIIPHLWFDTQAKEAAEFYASVFPNSKINNITVLHDTPSGGCDMVSFNRQ